MAYSEEQRRAALEELARRKLVEQQAEGVIAGIRTELFDKQLALLDDPSRNKAALCTRRAGKTSTWSRYAVITCIRKPNSIVRIWAQSRLRAKELMWNECKDVCSRHRISVKTHDTELRITFENRSEIRLVGADHDHSAQKKRGDKTTLEVVLEAQSFGPFLETLVEDVVEPSTFDTLGTVCLEGTPGPVPTGYFFWVTGGNDVESRWVSPGVAMKSNEDSDVQVLKGKNWSCHRWSVLDNPHLPHAAKEIAAVKKRKGWTDAHPRYLREYKGRWVIDLGSLFYKYDAKRNSYNIEDVKPWGPGWTHVLGWDIGFNDAMALVVWGWHENSPTLYECASWSESRVTSESVVAKINEYQGRFNVIKMVADTGGGGRLFVEEVQKRYGLSFEAAKKTEKFEHATLMNDDFIAGRIKTLPGSAYTGHVSILTVDPDWDPSTGKPPKEDPSTHHLTHTCDAGLYAWRYAYSYLPEEASKQLTPTEQVEQEMLDAMENNGKEEPWWEVSPDYQEMDE